MDEKKLICPLLNRECVAKQCAVAVAVDYDIGIGYHCGLVAMRYGQPTFIDWVDTKQKYEKSRT